MQQPKSPKHQSTQKSPYNKSNNTAKTPNYQTTQTTNIKFEINNFDNSNQAQTTKPNSSNTNHKTPEHASIQTTKLPEFLPHPNLKPQLGRQITKTQNPQPITQSQQVSKPRQRNQNRKKIQTQIHKNHTKLRKTQNH